MSVINDLEFLRQAARVSPPLKEAVARVEAEVERLTAESRIAWAALNSCRSAALADVGYDRLRARVLDETAAALNATEGRQG